MKNIYKFLIISLTIILISSTITNVIAIQKTETIYDDIILDFSFSEPILENIDNDEVTLTSVIVEDLPNTHDLGNPILPVKPVRILLPENTELNNIIVTPSDKITLGSGFNIAAGGYVIPISDMLEDRIKPEISTKNFNSLYSFVGVYSYRGFSILHLNLHPVQYDASNGELSYYKSMKLVIETNDIEKKSIIRHDIDDFEIVESLVDNPEVLETYDIIDIPVNNENYEYIIITNTNLKQSNEEYTFQDLVDFKIANGISAKIVTVEEIMDDPYFEIDGVWGDRNPSNPFYQSEITGNFDLFNDTPARIRNFIRYAYSELGTNYVLLGGDADVANPSDNIIPLRGLFANESGLPLNLPPQEEQDDIPSDVYYACLDGNFNYDCDGHFGESPDRNSVIELDEADLYAEVWVGRCCADSDEEVSNFVMKTINYAESGDSYLSDIMFIGEDLGEAFYFQYGGAYKDLMEYLVPSSYNMHKLYDSDEYIWYPSDFITELYNIEPQIINHDGHGFTNYMFKMGGSNFYELTNVKPFFVYSHSCLTGSFDNYVPWGGDYLEDDCIAEILTCEIPYGAFACILNSRYGLGSENSPEAPSGSLDESFYKALFTEDIKELGRANHYSKQDNIWRINENGYRWVFYQTNLFGDPQLRLKEPNNAPDKPTINGPNSGEKDITYTFQVSTSDPDNDEVYYWISWFDGCPGVSWQGPYVSGEEMSFNYTWEKSGNHIISVKARDEDGAVSEIAILEISIPKSKFISNFYYIFKQFPRFYLLFEKLFLV